MSEDLESFFALLSAKLDSLAAAEPSDAISAPNGPPYRIHLAPSNQVSAFFYEAQASVVEFDRTGFRRHLEAAIRSCHLGLSCADATDFQQRTMISLLLRLLHRRFDITDSSTDFDSTIRFIDRVLDTAAVIRFSSLRSSYMAAKAHLLTDYYRRQFMVRRYRVLDYNKMVVHANSAAEALHSARKSNDNLPGSASLETQLVLAYCTVVMSGDRFMASPTLHDWAAVLESGILLINNYHLLPELGLRLFKSTAMQEETYRNSIMMKMEIQLIRMEELIQQSTDLQLAMVTEDPEFQVELGQIDPMAKKLLVAIHEKITQVRQANPEQDTIDYLHESLAGHVIITCYGDDVHAMSANGDDPLPGLDVALASFGMTEFQLRFKLTVAPRQDVWAKEGGIYDQLAREEEERTARRVDWERRVETLEEEARGHLRRYVELGNSTSDLDATLKTCELALEAIPADICGPLRLRITLFIIRVYLRELDERLDAPETSSRFWTIIHFVELAGFAAPGAVNKDWFELLKHIIPPIRDGLARGAFSLSHLDRLIDVGMKVLEQAIANLTELWKLPRPSELPYFLAMCHKTRYRNTGADKDMDECIRLISMALSLPDDQVGSHDASRVAMRIEHAMILKMLYERTRSLVDLNRALDILQEVVEDGSLGLGPAQNRFIIMSNRVLLLQEKYNLTGDADDLDAAIELAEEGLAMLMSLGESSGAAFWTIEVGFLCNLANAISRRYSLTDDIDDLDLAFQHMSKAVELNAQSPNLANRGNLHHDFSVIVLQQYHARKDVEDLELAKNLLYTTLELFPQGHPLRGWCLMKLASCLTLQQAPENIIRQVYADAWACSSSTIVMRVEAAYALAEFHLASDDVVSAVAQLKDALGLLDDLEPGWIQNSQWSWKKCLDLPVTTCMLALRAGHSAAEALVLLEKGRSRTLGSIIDFRGEFDLPPGHELSDETLEILNYHRMRGEAAESSLEKRRYKEAIQDLVAQYPAFEAIMSPTPESYMKLAKDGPIATIMTSELSHSGLAIIVTSSRIYHLPLPDLNHEEMCDKLRDLMENIVYGESDTFSSRNKKLSELLGWLWSSVVEPILRDLSFHEGNTESGATLPRVRWIGVGLLSNAPFHAAGLYAKRGTGHGAMDCVVSSYAPSLRALLYTNHRIQPKTVGRAEGMSNILIVKVAEAEGANPLVHVQGEIQAVSAAAAAASMQVKILDAPTGPCVLDQLPLYNLVHFACHGVSDLTNPTQSHLVLKDSELTVKEIMSAYSSRPDLAFLSACSTAQGQGAQVVDESLHIASAFVMTGFRHVVGTLWNADDRACMEVARKFYGKLFETEGGTSMRADGTLNVSDALHFAVKELKVLAPRSPLVWATFVAFGL